MTSTADRYLEQVTRRVVAPASRVESLRADLESHFTDAAERGESEQDVIARLGTPEEVAAAFMEGVELRFAGFWERLVAFIGDFGLCCLLLSPFVAACAVLGPAFETTESPVLGVLFAAAFVLFVLGTIGIFVLYFPLLEHLFGKTWAKHVLKLRVVTEDGAPIGLGAAFIRRLSFYFEVLWLDALFVPFTEKKQRAFDIVAKTLVVREPDAERGAGAWLLCLAPWLLVAMVVAAAVALSPATT